jgi:hypothetical protein
MTEQPTFDATYLSTGDCEFNKGENWEGGRVPDGTGTVYSANCLNSRLTFSRGITTLGALRLLRDTGIELAAGQTLNLGQGIYAGPDASQLEIKNYGTINGGVHITGRTTGQNYLQGDGTINGNVIFEGDWLMPGGFGQKGTLTVNGSVALGRIDGPPSRGTGVNIIVAKDGSSSHLLVNGPVEVRGDYAFIRIEPSGPEKDFPPHAVYTALTAKGGLKGKLQLNSSGWFLDYDVTLTRDDRHAYVTIQRRG